MNIINPTITVQNTEGDRYLVRFQHTFGNQETLDCSVLIAKGNHSLGEVSRLALGRLIELAGAITPHE